MPLPLYRRASFVAYRKRDATARRATSFLNYLLKEMKMVKFVELDPAIGIRDQLASSVEGPLTLANVFHVAEADVDALLAAWEDDANYFKSQPGFISTQLHRGIAGSTTFLNCAIWENIEAFRAAFNNPVFHSKLGNYPESAVTSPHLFQRLTVKNLCVA